MPELENGVLVWGRDLIEDNTMQQAAKAAELPFVTGPVALMPDAHVGKGSTIGSVIPTRGAVIPAAVGVDIGCGMAAVLTPFTSQSLPDNLSGFLKHLPSVVPAGLGQDHGKRTAAAVEWLAEHPNENVETDERLKAKTLKQFGSLGSGNHFFEVCLDEQDRVWLVLHSGSRGVGNKLAMRHIAEAKDLAARMFLPLPDVDLAYLPEGSPAFDAYIGDLLWAQDYALANREQMMESALDAFCRHVGSDRLYANDELLRINCHHNYATMEHHQGRDAWITRKGAIRAREGDFGIIPGSMGASTFIVKGLGNEASYTSCSHGAGRRLSRTKAHKRLSVDTLREQMSGQVWNNSKATKLLDEAPDAYKDVNAVMAAQSDLVSIEHTLHSILNYKGV